MGAMKQVEPQSESGPSVLERAHSALRETLVRGFARLANGPACLVRATCLALAFSLFITFPRISFFTGKDEQIVNFWPVIEAQMAAPFTPAPELDPTDHSGKRAFRLTTPLLGRLLHLDWRGLLLVQFMLGILLLYLTGRIALDLFGDRVVATATVFAFACTYMGKAAFLELGGVGDGFALAFFALAAYDRSAPVVFAMVVLACFTDERALAAAPLMAVYWHIREGREKRVWLATPALAVCGAILFSLALRVVLAVSCGLRVPIGSRYGVGLRPFLANLGPIQWQLPRSLAGFWLWVAVAVWLLWQQRRRTLLLLIGGLTLAVVGAAMLAFDLDRGLLYLFPLVLIAGAVAARAGLEPADLREIAAFCFLVCLLVPVNSLIGSPSNRYSEGNLLPVEIVRFIYYWRRP
jgi:hypothetical protein